MIQTVREDRFTGVVGLEGSSQWGWGKVDAHTAVKLALMTLGTEKTEIEIDWTVFPEQAIDYLFFTLVDEFPKRVQIVDAQGKVIERKTQQASVFVGDLRPGVYSLRIERKGRIEQVNFKKNG